VLVWWIFVNSGIRFVSEKKEYYLFEGYSGSIYKCFKECYGTHMYGHGVLEDIIERSKKHGVTLEIMPENTAWLKLHYT